MLAKTETSTYLSAQWVLPLSSPPLENGVVEFADGRISRVLSRAEFLESKPELELDDYGPAIIVPGLINLHTHLDYSALRWLDTESGLFQWIRCLMRQVRQWTAEQWSTSALLGAEQIALSGTTCVADSSYTGISTACALAQTGLRGVVGLELFGNDPSKADNVFKQWLTRLENLHALNHPLLGQSIQAGRLQLTVAPHAPYTVCPQLWDQAARWSQAHNLPLLCHLAESLGECRWIARDDDEVESFLSAVDPGYSPNNRHIFSWKGQGQSPVEHLEQHRLLTDTTVAAHAVHLSNQDLKLLSARRVKVAHCPRSNARLRNGIAHLNQLIEAGVDVGFGTDSLAATDSLDVLSEARFAWNLQRAVNPSFNRHPEEAIYRLTLGAAKALNLDNKIGSLEPGKDADLAVFALDSSQAAGSNRPYDMLLYGGLRLRDLFVQGQPVVKEGVLSRFT